MKRKAMTTEKARQVRAQGHQDALEFALAIGLAKDYGNDRQAKKDVIDPSGDAHSVKSGAIRWQIFLYHKSRFETDYAFQSMNGIGQLLIECLDVFPDNFDEYKKNKQHCKQKLQNIMKKLCEKFQEERRVKTFLAKSLFNGDEVNYLTIKHNGTFHVFLNKDVVTMLGQNLVVENSQARKVNDNPAQKVLFKYNGNNLGELEMRNSSLNHYKEVLFVMNKLKVIGLLFGKIPMTKKFNDMVSIYGNASKRFGRW